MGRVTEVQGDNLRVAWEAAGEQHVLRKEVELMSA